MSQKDQRLLILQGDMEEATLLSLQTPYAPQLTPSTPPPAREGQIYHFPLSYHL